MAINRVLYNIMTADLGATKDFYLRLLDMHLLYESDWYIVLKPTEDAPHELGIIDVNHQVVPEAYRATPQGAYVTFVVDDVLTTFGRAKELGLDVIQEPTDLFYGQRRMLLRDPNGLLVDVSSPTPSG
jgi:catechol 2,3-dioxygenase-like lactoylglutathione lyase family enzyme